MIPLAGDKRMIIKDIDLITILGNGSFDVQTIPTKFEKEMLFLQLRVNPAYKMHCCRSISYQHKLAMKFSHILGNY